MVLQLIHEEILHYPILYISGYINQHRTEYYHLLRKVSLSNDWHGFILYMLKGFYEQARSTKESLFAVMDLYGKAKEDMRQKLPKTYSADLVDVLFSYPIITPTTLAEKLSIHRRTAARYLEDLKTHHFLSDEVMGKFHLYINKSLIELFSKG